MSSFALSMSWNFVFKWLFNATQFCLSIQFILKLINHSVHMFLFFLGSLIKKLDPFRLLGFGQLEAGAKIIVFVS